MHDFAFAADGGRIVRAGDGDSIVTQYPDAPRMDYGEERLLAPGAINGHSHCYQILLRGWADDWGFERWRSDALYRIIPQLTPDELYWVALSAFVEMLGNGITTVVEFFYLNGGGTQHLERLVEAAVDCGIRLVVARAWMDADFAPPAFREEIAQARRDTLALAEDLRGLGIMVCPAPHSLHAASAEMTRAAVDLARELGVPAHMHVAEARYEVEQVRGRTGLTPIAYLDSLGVLGSDFVAVHGIWQTEEEKELMAERGAALIHNPVTNQYLGDGIADIVGLRRRGVRVGLGTDCNLRPCIYDEMRAASFLQKIATLDGATLSAHDAWMMGTREGAHAIGIEAGDFTEGCYADWCVVDRTHPSFHPWSHPVNQMVYVSDPGIVVETFVGGRKVSDRRRAQRYGNERIAAEVRRVAERLRLPMDPAGPGT
ncbi:MAG TPA: amidohydrolase family protein [Candidatus Dormibacteraeota bacterium]|nr:amidohydrolase family protein [Candidatus Dormibacteraeota bacterium]